MLSAVVGVQLFKVANYTTRYNYFNLSHNATQLRSHSCAKTNEIMINDKRTIKLMFKREIYTKR